MNAPGVPRTPLIEPEWPAARRVRAVSTERSGGVSQGAYESCNFGAHVGDESTHVLANKAALAQRLELPVPPLWLEQVHSNTVLDPGANSWESPPGREPGPPIADGTVTSHAGRGCVVTTADCLPVLLCNTAGTRVGAAHAGWRGLASGVLAHAVASMGGEPGELLAWLGPAIGPGAYEVGAEVRTAFVSQDPGAAACFEPNESGRWQADLYGLARRSLIGAGVRAIYGGDFCTYTEAGRFFSHRRQAPCGRMATLIWLDA